MPIRSEIKITSLPSLLAYDKPFHFMHVNCVVIVIIMADELFGLSWFYRHFHLNNSIDLVGYRRSCLMR